MARLNLTLDTDTLRRLDAHARRAGERTASLARTLLREALDRREERERLRKLAQDYARGRKDARALLKDLEAPQLEVLEDQD